eukprot:1541841-Pleurochrysis_carterae.AAC.2
MSQAARSYANSCALRLRPAPACACELACLCVYSHAHTHAAFARCCARVRTCVLARVPPRAIDECVSSPLHEPQECVPA